MHLDPERAQNRDRCAHQTIILNDRTEKNMDARSSPTVNTQPSRGTATDETEIRRRSLERWENEGGQCNDDLTEPPVTRGGTARALHAM